MKNKVYEWFVEYLTEHKQRVRVRKALSGELNTFSSVLQGNFHEPLLFILHFNNISLRSTVHYKFVC